MSKPSNPTLWNEMKRKARTTSEGSPSGKWSPRKAAIARMAYRAKGGKWEKARPAKPARKG